VFAISTGVAAVADNTWSAAKGREALTIHFDEGPRAGVSTEAIRQDPDHWSAAGAGFAGCR